ncbi:MAG: EcsC family protein [Desulfarculaceae bacterium]|nr:EcsC family protein [Desulfarculaceae bacterium]MCF8102140.1 EcsC family protein [Desulfarculaceae bacterium]MCF8118315.1 EcsC family protein [Desulfarculaceae bacterium]
MGGMSKYEKLALLSIHEWKNPQVGWWGRTMEVVNYPADKAGELVMKTPGVDWVIQKTIGGLVSLINDLAHLSVRSDAIYDEYRKAGYYKVKIASDIFMLDLEKTDRVNGWLSAKYKTIAAVEGGGTGFVGMPGIPVDIVALVGLNLRAIGEYATYYGFDISLQNERLFALNILGLASSPNDAAKQVALAQLVKISKDVAKKKVWKELEKHSFVKIVKKIAETIGIRLTKAKLAQVIPYAGAAIGLGFNAYYTDKVCDAAFYLYRERFLAQKYGDDIIEETVAEAKGYLPNYDE